LWRWRTGDHPRRAPVSIGMASPASGSWKEPPVRLHHPRILRGIFRKRRNRYRGWRILRQSVRGASRPVNSSHPPRAPFSLQKITG
jgi:hypothetical protein